MTTHYMSVIHTHTGRSLRHLVRDDGEVDGEGKQDGDGGAHLLPAVGRQSEHQRGRQRQEQHGDDDGDHVVQAETLHRDGKGHA